MVNSGAGDTRETVTLAQIVAALEVTYRPDAVVTYLCAANRHLNNATPLQFIEAGDIARVVQVVARIGDADPADFRVERRDA